MGIDLSKLCTDFLRQYHASQSAEKLKASHARELVAAFFGYKSHAALMAESIFPLKNLEEAYIFVPDIPLLEGRRKKMHGLPADLIPSQDIAKLLSDLLVNEGLCGGNVWLYETLEGYIAEVLLVDCQQIIEDQISGVMAETNASFSDSPYYECLDIQDNGSELVVIAKAQYKGEALEDRPFCGDTIDVSVQVTLPRMAGRRGFYEFELEAGGSINDDWVGPELSNEVPNVRPKEQWLEMTGGFRFGESPEDFQKRQIEIHYLRNRISRGELSVNDIHRLSYLLGTDQSDEFGDMF